MEAARIAGYSGGPAGWTVAGYWCAKNKDVVDALKRSREKLQQPDPRDTLAKIIG